MRIVWLWNIDKMLFVVFPSYSPKKKCYINKKPSSHIGWQRDLFLWFFHYSILFQLGLDFFLNRIFILNINSNIFTSTKYRHCVGVKWPDFCQDYISSSSGDLNYLGCFHFLSMHCCQVGWSELPFSFLYKAEDLCDKACDPITTTCTVVDGRYKCTCKNGYHENDFIDRVCRGKKV